MELRQRLEFAGPGEVALDTLDPAYFLFYNAVGTARPVEYAILDDGGVLWESGGGFLTARGGFTRTKVLKKYGGGTEPLSFPPGVKLVHLSSTPAFGLLTDESGNALTTHLADDVRSVAVRMPSAERMVVELVQALQRTTFAAEQIGVNAAQVQMLGFGRVAVTGAYTVFPTERGKVIDCTSGTFTVSLSPAATFGDAFWFAIYNSGSGTITLDPAGSETIRRASGAATSLTLGQGRGLIICCDGSNFIAFDNVPLTIAVPSQTNITNGDVLSAGGAWVPTGGVPGASALVTLYAATGSSANSGTGETDLMSSALGAGLIGTNLTRIKYRAALTIANNANAKRVRVYLGASLVFDSGSGVIPASAALACVIEGEVIRVSATTQECNAVMVLDAADGTRQAMSYRGTGSETLASALTFKFTGQGGASNDILQKSLTIEFGNYTTGILVTGTLAQPYQCETYSSTLGVTNGTAPYTYTVIAGALPAGLSINATTGEISGTPTSNEVAQSVTIQVQDVFGAVGSSTQSLTVKDLKFSSVVALLHFEGANGSQANFNDVSGKSWAWAGNGQISTSSPLMGTSSALFDGNTDWVQSNDHADWNLGSGDFSITYWAKTDVTTGDHCVTSQISAGFNGHQLYLRPTEIQFWTYNASGSGAGVSIAITRDTNAHYYEISRISGTTYVFVDGVLKGSSSTVITMGDSSGVLNIGIDWDHASNAFKGRIDELRINKGAGRHTTGYVPPTGPSPDL